MLTGRSGFPKSCLPSIPTYDGLNCLRSRTRGNRTMNECKMNGGIVSDSVARICSCVIRAPVAPCARRTARKRTRPPMQYGPGSWFADGDQAEPTARKFRQMKAVLIWRLQRNARANQAGRKTTCRATHATWAARNLPATNPDVGQTRFLTVDSIDCRRLGPRFWWVELAEVPEGVCLL
jgi:hypothetical protein